jgi:hypothetical protein
MQGMQLNEMSLELGINTVKVDMNGFAQETYLCVLVIDGYNVGNVKIVKE